MKMLMLRKGIILSTLTLQVCLVRLHAQVFQVSAGLEHTCVLLVDATIKCWGHSFNGRLGYEDLNNRGNAAGEMGDDLPRVNLGTGHTALQIATGFSHTCARLDDATVKCWGGNLQGQLGYGDTTDRGDGQGEMGNNLPTLDLGAGRTAVKITVGGDHACAMLDDATVKCWGRNSNGQLGYGDTNNRGNAPGEMGDDLPQVDLGTGRTALQIEAQGLHTCVLLDDSTVKCWGHGAFGQLGYGDTSDRGDGPGEMGDDLPTVDLGTGRTAVRIALGNEHTCALLDDATVKCWGHSFNGRLGYGDTNNRGNAPGEMGDNLAAVDLGAGRTAVQVATGGSHTCVQLDDMSVKCWGRNTNGQLGYGDTNDRGNVPGEMGDDLPVIDLGTGRTAAKIAIGGEHTCMLLDDSSVKCWGSGFFGQLGYGDVTNRGDGSGELGNNLPTVDLGSDITTFPTAAPSFVPSRSPTLVPTLTSAAVGQSRWANPTVTVLGVACCYIGYLQDSLKF